MCSMKWATPTWSAVSRREPARTYAATETERAPGIRALITRGPAGSAVRSNMARDGTGIMPTPRVVAPGASWKLGGRGSGWQVRLDPVLPEVDDEGDGHTPHERMDLGELATHNLDQDVGDERG